MIQNNWYLASGIYFPFSPANQYAYIITAMIVPISFVVLLLVSAIVAVIYM